MNNVLKHIPALVFALFLNALLLSSTSAAQDDEPLRADINENLKPQELKKALQELQETVDNETREFPSEHYVELAEWVLEKFDKWRKLHPPQNSQSAPLPLDEKSQENATPFANTNPAPKVEPAILNTYDFSFTLNSIFKKFFSSNPNDSLQHFISLTKKHPCLRSEPTFASLLNNYLISANIQKITSGKILSKSLPESKGNLPDFLENAKPQLQSAWRKAKFIEDTLTHLYPNDDTDTTPFRFLGNNTSYDAIIGECLIDNNWENASEIQNYTWGNWCGFGSKEFTWQKLNFLTLYQAKLGKKNEALALFLYSWLSQQGNFSSTIYDFDTKNWDELISLRIRQAKIKWESPASGMLFSSTLRIAPKRLTSKAGHETMDILSLTKGLQLPDSKNVLEIIVAILKRHSDHDRVYQGDPFAETQVGKSALSQSSEARAMQALASLVHKVDYGTVLTDAIILLADRSPDTSKNDLHRLASSPIPSVSRAAYYALKEIGYLDEFKPIAPSKQEKYNLTFLLGGKPLSGLPIYTEQILIHPELKSYTQFGWKAGVELDSKGKMLLTRNNDSHSSDTRGFFAAYYNGKESPIQWTQDTPIFAFRESFAELKKRSNQIIDIPACPLEIKLLIPESRLPHPENATPTLIIIDAKPLPLADVKMDRFFSTTHYRLETQQDHVKIDRAGPARYSFHVQASGCAIYTQIEPVTVTQEQEILIKLEPGFKLKYSLDSKNTENFSVSLMRLSIDAKGLEQWEEILPTFPNSEFSYWNHLAPGKYQMIVYDRSSTPFKTSETNFEIKFNDPEIVDLGKISVPL